MGGFPEIQSSHLSSEDIRSNGRLSHGYNLDCKAPREVQEDPQTYIHGNGAHSNHPRMNSRGLLPAAILNLT